jgi:hypothetical protein
MSINGLWAGQGGKIGVRKPERERRGKPEQAGDGPNNAKTKRTFVDLVKHGRIYEQWIHVNYRGRLVEVEGAVVAWIVVQVIRVGAAVEVVSRGTRKDSRAIIDTERRSEPGSVKVSSESHPGLWWCIAYVMSGIWYVVW